MSEHTLDGRARADALDRSIVSARRFRGVLTAMARPAQPVDLSDGARTPADAPPPMSPAAAATLTTLADADASYWLAPSRAAQPVEHALRFATGVGPAAAPADAAFCVGAWPELLELAATTARIGEPDYPDRSTTLIVEVDGFESGPAARFSGPGLKDPVLLQIDGVDDAFWRLLARNRGLFPLGVDVMLTSGDLLVGLPRSIIAEPF